MNNLAIGSFDSHEPRIASTLSVTIGAYRDSKRAVQSGRVCIVGSDLFSQNNALCEENLNQQKSETSQPSHFQTALAELKESPSQLVLESLAGSIGDQRPCQSTLLVARLRVNAMQCNASRVAPNELRLQHLRTLLHVV